MQAVPMDLNMLRIKQQITEERHALALRRDDFMEYVEKKQAQEQQARAARWVAFRAQHLHLMTYGEA